MNILDTLAKHLTLGFADAVHMNKTIGEPETRVASLLMEHLSKAVREAAKEINTNQREELLERIAHLERMQDLRPPSFKALDTEGLIGLVVSHLQALTPEARLAFWARSHAGYCWNCGIATVGPCHCRNDE